MRGTTTSTASKLGPNDRKPDEKIYIINENNKNKYKYKYVHTEEGKQSYLEALYKIEEKRHFRQPQKNDKYPRESKMKTIIVLTFKNKYKKDKREEFSRQLRGQEEGLANLTVAEILLNKEEYRQRKKAEQEQGKPRPSGRDPSGNDIQKKVQKETRDNFELEKQKELFRKFECDNARNPNEEEEKEIKKIAKDYANKKMGNRKYAALHEPDQIAGGYAKNVTGLGLFGVNSSIGSQWETNGNAAIMEENLWNYIYDNKISPEECAFLFTNIKLKEIRKYE